MLRSRARILTTLLLILITNYVGAKMEPLGRETWRTFALNGSISFHQATPSVEALIHPDSLPLSPDCDITVVTGIVLGFLDAFNHGDVIALATYFSPIPATRTRNVEPGRFTVFSAYHPDGGVTIYDPSELLPYFDARHQRHEQLELLQLVINRAPRNEGVGFVFDVARQADDIPSYVAGGKGGVLCEDRTISGWVMGADEAVSGLLPPTVPGEIPAPEDCRIEPRPQSELATPMNSQLPAQAVSTPATISPPAGTPIAADDPVTTGIVATVLEWAACFNAGDYPRAAAFFTDSYWSRGASVSRALSVPGLMSELAGLPPDGGPINSRIRIDRVGVPYEQPDGRTSLNVLLRREGNTQPMSSTFLFVEVNGRWLIDEVITAEGP